MLEATRDCSQSLTIFGEKWPGAVKYRDIFDALSGNLLKSIVNPGSSHASSEAARRRHVNTEAAQYVSGQAIHTQQANLGQANAHGNHTVDTSMGDMVSDAVKEAFMEVDGEAPGDGRDGGCGTRWSKTMRLLFRILRLECVGAALET